MISLILQKAYDLLLNYQTSYFMYYLMMKLNLKNYHCPFPSQKLIINFWLLEKEVTLEIPIHTKSGYEIRWLDYDEKCSSVKQFCKK